MTEQEREKDEYWLPLNKTQAEQLLSYVEYVERKDWYYGDKRWFKQRHAHIKRCLENILMKHIDGLCSKCGRTSDVVDMRICPFCHPTTDETLKDSPNPQPL